MTSCESVGPQRRGALPEPRFVAAAVRLSGSSGTRDNSRMATIATADWMEGDVLPLDAKVERRGLFTWDDAPVDRDAFESSLRDEGVPDDEIEEALQLRDEYIELADRYNAFAHARLGVPERLKQYGGEGGDEGPAFMTDIHEARRRLVDKMMGRGFELEASELVEVRIPLFTLAAADSEGCSANLAVAERRSKWVIDWGIKVFGSGLSGTAGFSVSSTASFSAMHGETKVIFLPVSFTVQSGTVTKRGKAVGSARRADLLSVKGGALGLLLLEKGLEPPIGERVETYLLAGDTSGAVATYEYTAEKMASRKMNLGAKVLGAELSIGTEITRNNQMVLTYGLRGGRDYELHRVADGDGLVWKPLAV